MAEESKAENAKLPYEKPELRTIELAADEVLAAGCKVASGIRGPGKPKQTCAWPGGECFGPGS